MKNYTYFTLITILLLFTNCHRNKLDNEKKETISTNFNSSIMDFKNYFNSFEVIYLDKKYPLASIKKIEVKNDKLFIQTRSGKTRAYIYNINSNKLIKISKLGKGPKEYLSLRDIYLENKSLNLVDYSNKRILKFSFSGKHIDNISFPIYFDRAHQLDTNLYVLFKKVKYQDKQENKINIYSTEKNKFISNHIEINSISDKRDFTQTRNLYKFEDSLRLFQTFSKNIFNISKNGITSRYIINSAPYQLPEKLLNNTKLSLFEFIEECKSSPYIWGYNNILENNKYLIYSFKYKSNNYINFYNKNNKQSNSFNSFSNYFLMGLDTIKYTQHFYPIAINNESLFFYLEPYFLIDKMKIPKKREFLRKNNLSNLTYDDNPIILKYNFKN